ncbi:alpha/beta hydrolase [Nocardioides anomalus]|uniref:Alpha/beta hydrolase n=1 Tax=Nocardioides anomalus TaxID=2712223 RepID=A0A6G6WAA8_9ACTN|nr:alpha/beta hydrolase [Nocardioides anomalus]QIG42164.1 alpha/beta hydrolase [Nocardioides anomalus]
MALYPEARRAVEAAQGEPQVHDDGYDVAAARAANRAAALAEEPLELAEIRDLDAAGVPVRLYRPAGADPGLVVHLHGGGFVFHDLDVHDRVCRRFADRLGMAVLSVDYRLAPEHPFPAAPDDVDTVLAWLRGSDLAAGGPTYVHGDSAGGNLALVAALRHPGRFAAVVLHYPFLDPTAAGESYALGAAADFDPREAAWYWQQYAATDADRTDPDLAPLLSDRLGTLPPTLVTTAEHDPLRDEGELLAARIAEAGGDVTCVRYLGQIHGYWRHPVFPAAEQALRQTCAFLRGHGVA